MSIRIIEVFVKIREMFLTHQEIIERLGTIEGSLTKHEELIIEIYRYLQQIEEEKKMQADQIQRKRIGYKTREDERSKKSGNH